MFTPAGSVTPACADTTVGGASIEPIRMVKRAAAYPKHVGKTFEVEIECCTAAVAKMYGDALAAAVRAVVINLRIARQHHILFLEDGLDEVGRAGEALAEGAVANGDPNRLAGGLITHIAAQTTSCMSGCGGKARRRGGGDSACHETLPFRPLNGDRFSVPLKPISEILDFGSPHARLRHDKKVAD